MCVCVRVVSEQMSVLALCKGLCARVSVCVFVLLSVHVCLCVFKHLYLVFLCVNVFIRLFLHIDYAFVCLCLHLLIQVAM